jgi:arabinose-5-phosphate isomerase
VTSQPSLRLSRAAEVIRAEARTIAGLEELLDAQFERAVELVLGCRGMVVVTGMGKAGLIGSKVSSTLASTGTPSLVLHPAEAGHGDLGRIRSNDVLLALSNSGETAEVKALIGPARRLGASLIAITGRTDSTLAREADCVLDIGRAEEACPLKLALGDALAVVVQQERGFSREDYARFHPGGALGRSLMRVAEVMRRGDQVPLVQSGLSLREALVVSSRTPGRPGCAVVVDADGRMAGIFTDGDLRRVLQLGGAPPLDEPIDDVMAREPKHARPQMLVDEAVRILRRHRIDQLPVLDDEGRPIGLIDIQDALDVRV